MAAAVGFWAFWAVGRVGWGVGSCDREGKRVTYCNERMTPSRQAGWGERRDETYVKPGCFSSSAKMEEERMMMRKGVWRILGL